ncbi:MAG: serine protease, partial [Pseudomonadota bacterium]|nr:serine protease [Pseudomonadota bacterium]
MEPLQCMRRGWVFAVGVATCMSTTAGLAPDELFRNVSPSVWQVATTDDAGKPLATGSAVVVAPGSLVTNCHVLKGAASVSVRQGRVIERATLEHADAERDLCLLAASGVRAAPVLLAPRAAQVGQRIYTIGAPRGLEATLSDGLVSGLRHHETTGALAYVQISAPISPGSSGGGLFDDEGRLLGITTSGLVGVAQNLNFARPASMIPEIPARAQAALARWRDGQGPSTAVARASSPSAPERPAPAPRIRPATPPVTAT